MLKPENEVEECFRQAIEISRRRLAKSWELRATMSLSRLWQSQGKREEAKKALAEARDFKILQEADASSFR